MKKIIALICVIATLMVICSCESVVTPTDLARRFGNLNSSNVAKITSETKVESKGEETSLITVVMTSSDLRVVTTEKKINSEPIGDKYVTTTKGETLSAEKFTARIPVPNMFDTTLSEEEYTLETVKNEDKTTSETYKISIADSKVKEFLGDSFSAEEIANITSIKCEAYFNDSKPVSYKVTFVMYGANVTISVKFEY